jgi:hypothetical protein
MPGGVGGGEGNGGVEFRSGDGDAGGLAKDGLPTLCVLANAMTTERRAYTPTLSIIGIMGFPTALFTRLVQ